MCSLPWKMLVLRTSNDILSSCVNAPQRVEGYFTYFYENVDLLFLRNSGKKIGLYKVGSGAELWDKAAEVSVDDLIDEQAQSLASLYAQMATRQVDEWLIKIFSC